MGFDSPTEIRLEGDIDQRLNRRYVSCRWRLVELTH